MIILILALLGLALGSFINALVWRLRRQETSKDKRKYSIKNGRSMCVSCEHKLAARDLIPVLSWLTLKGKCRYCGKLIHWQYPLVEATTAGLFVFSYAFWPVGLDNFTQLLSFSLWLVLLCGLVALVIYDIRWMLLPNKVIFPLMYLAGARVVLESIAESSLQPVISAALGAAVGGGLFYVLFQLSKGRWIGGGDVKLGFLLGVVLGAADLALMMIFLASFMGVLVSGPLLLSGKVSRNTHIPFGPFLIAAGVISMFFGRDILRWYAGLVL